MGYNTQTHRNDPGRPLPAEITHLTGITDDDLQGRQIDVEAASTLIHSCQLIVAHNARFDRPFVECVLPAARDKPWACTREQVPWTAERFASQALHCLLCAYGVYARGRHRALADCEAGVWLLAQRLPVSGDTVLAAMRRQALTPTERIWAIRSPFASKDLLRTRGYRWMPEMRHAIERSWWTEVEPDEVDAELAWLREHVYSGWPLLPLPRGRVTARDRWRADPTRCTLLDPVHGQPTSPLRSRQKQGLPPADNQGDKTSEFDKACPSLAANPPRASRHPRRPVRCGASPQSTIAPWTRAPLGPSHPGELAPVTVAHDPACPPPMSRRPIASGRRRAPDLTQRAKNASRNAVTARPRSSAIETPLVERDVLALAQHPHDRGAGRGEDVCGVADGLPEFRDGAGGAALEVGVELGEGHLDWVGIGPVGRQEAQLRPDPADGLTRSGTAMGSEVVHHHDFAGRKRPGTSPAGAPHAPRRVVPASRGVGPPPAPRAPRATVALRTSTRPAAVRPALRPNQEEPPIHGHHLVRTRA